MHLLDRIETQLISNRLPLVAITRSGRALCQHASGAHPALAWLCGNAARRGGRRQHRRVPAGALIGAADQRSLGCNSQLENEVLDVAWELGSWDLGGSAALRAAGRRRAGIARVHGGVRLASLLVDGQPPASNPRPRRQSFCQRPSPPSESMGLRASKPLAV